MSHIDCDLYKTNNPGLFKPGTCDFYFFVLFIVGKEYNWFTLDGWGDAVEVECNKEVAACKEYGQCFLSDLGQFTALLQHVAPVATGQEEKAKKKKK